MVHEILLVASLTKFDPNFCPKAGSPVVYQQTVSMGRSASGLFDRPNSVQIAGQLVDTAKHKLIGWIYFDEHDVPYVSLLPHVDHATYVFFGMDKHNRYRAGVATEAIGQESRRLPRHVEIRSCTEMEASY